MARRRKAKLKRSSVASKHGITQKSYDRIKREATNTRRRIKNLTTANNGSSFLPDAEDYKLENILRRIDSGEKVKNILKEMSQINFASFKQAEEQPLYRTKYGFYVERNDRERLIKAINTANRNIDKATRRYGEFADLMPQKFNVEKVLEEISSDEALRNRLTGIRKFTASKLVPTMIEGVFTTKAEYEYLTDIINRENKRREERQKPPEEGYLVTQAQYDSKPINIEKLVDLNSIRRKAEQWDDPARVERANRYLDIYKESLNRAQATLADSGYAGREVEKRFRDINRIIDRLYNNVDRVTQLANNMPTIDIQIISDIIMGDVNFSEIYDDWMEYGRLLDAENLRS